MPWHLPEDLDFFRRETIGGAVIMGRRTWLSIPSRPLENRLNCVISSDTGVAETVFAKVEDAVAHARSAGIHRIYGIGGQGIFRDLLGAANRMLITEVDLSVENADTFFPDFDEDLWSCIQQSVLRSHGPRCVVRELIRR